MKKVLKTVLALLTITTFLMQSVVAAGVVTIYGKTENTDRDITVLALRADADIDNLSFADIMYVNQFEIDENGKFALTLPLSADDEFMIYSNRDFNKYDGTEEKGAVYVSALSGNDDNDGATETTAFKTLDAAYAELYRTDEIILLDDVTYSAVPEYSGKLKIKGKTASVNLNISGEISLKGDLTFDNLVLNGTGTIYANGYNLKVTETVTSSGSNRLFAYGGTKTAKYEGDTSIEILGGRWQMVFGGGHLAELDGNTNVIFGGNANSGDSATNSPCIVFGGGNNYAVSGTTNVTFQGNAVANYVVGAGYNTGGTVGGTNVKINGGSIMNVYGGAKTAVLNCDTNIEMNGGTVEGLFGGSEWAAMTGNANIAVKGGTVTRRIYSGCYNDYGFGGFDSSRYVNGSTTLALYPDAKLVTGSEANRGIFCGSRIASNPADEHNMLIFADGSYGVHSSKIGEKGGIKVCDSHQDYTVVATTGGEVQKGDGNGAISIIADEGYEGRADGKSCDTYTVASGKTVNIEFVKILYAINNLNATKGEASTSGNVDIIAEDEFGTIKPTLYVTVFEAESGKLIGCAVQSATTGNKTFEMDCEFEENTKYIVKAMLWNESLTPLTTYYSIELK